MLSTKDTMKSKNLISTSLMNAIVWWGKTCINQIIKNNLFLVVTCAMKKGIKRVRLWPGLGHHGRLPKEEVFGLVL